MTAPGRGAWTEPHGPFAVENLGGYLRVVDADGHDVCGLGDCREPGTWDAARWLRDLLNRAASERSR